MLAPIVPTVDYKKPYQRIHTWKEKILRCNLKTFVREDSQPIPTFPTTQVIEYTNEEYESVLKNPQWTKEETDQLMWLCKEYNLRFVIVHDRYQCWIDSTQNTSRSIEELKQRYYQVNRLLLHSRNPNKDNHIKDVIASYSFDIVKEQARLQNSNTLLSRSEAQLKEEEHLVCQVQQWLRRDWARRERVYKWVSHNAEAAQQYTEKSSLLKRKQKMKKEDGIDVPAVPTTGVRLASQRISVIKPSLIAKAHLLFEEFGIPIVPEMTTLQVTDIMNQVISSVMSLLEVRKTQEKLQHDIKIALANKKTMEADIAAGKPVSLKRSSSFSTGHRESKRFRINI